MKKPIARKKGVGEEREAVMEAVFRGALAVIAKHKAAKEEPPPIFETLLAVEAAERGIKAKAKPVTRKELATEKKQLRRGDLVQFDGVKYVFFRFNKQKQAILDPVGEGQRVVVNVNQLT